MRSRRQFLTWVCGAVFLFISFSSPADSTDDAWAGANKLLKSETKALRKLGWLSLVSLHRSAPNAKFWSEEWIKQTEPQALKENIFESFTWLLETYKSVPQFRFTAFEGKVKSDPAEKKFLVAALAQWLNGGDDILNVPSDFSRRSHRVTLALLQGKPLMKDELD